MRHHKSFPLLMGAAMAPMMLFMLHADLMSADFGALSAKLAGFVLLHIAALAVFACVGAFILRKRLHVPSLSHIGLMLAGAVASAASIHIIMHSWIV